MKFKERVALDRIKEMLPAASTELLERVKELLDAELAKRQTPKN